MDSGTFVLDFDEKRKRVDIELAKVASVFSEVKSFGLAPLVMEGHESLFTKHMSFREAHKHMKNPVMKLSEINTNYVTIDYEVEYEAFKNMVSALSQAISSIKVTTSDETADVDVLETVLRCFVPFPQISYKEVYLEKGSRNKLVGGKIDLLVGSEGNGNKQVFKLKENSREATLRNVYIVCIAEGKKIDVNHISMASVNSDFTGLVKQDMSLVQPMVELMAISEVCEHQNEEVPIINIFGNRQTIRPLLYFKKYDVMLTTPKPFTFMISSKELCLHGLILFHLLCNMHRYPFHVDKLRNTNSTGWAKAQGDNNPRAYGRSIVTNEALPQLQAINSNIMFPHLHTEDSRSSAFRKRKDPPSTSSYEAAKRTK